MPLFDYTDLVWGDKHNATLMSSLQILPNKAVKIVLDRHLYSPASHALATLKYITLENRRLRRRCVHMYKCLNGTSIYKLGDVGISSNLIGSLSLTNGHCPPPRRWIKKQWPA